MASAITSGNSSTFTTNPIQSTHYIAVTGAGSATVVPWIGGMSTGSTSFSVATETVYNMAGVSQFVITAVGGDIEVSVK